MEWGTHSHHHNGGKLYCKRGHPLTDDNVFYQTTYNKARTRQYQSKNCRECKRLYSLRTARKSRGQEVPPL